MKAPDQDIDLGLAVLSAMRSPGERFPRSVIAAACGCTKPAIYLIEKRALRKLANRLMTKRYAALREAVETVIGRDLR